MRRVIVMKRLIMTVSVALAMISFSSGNADAQEIPENAYQTPYGKGWTCQSRFFERKSKCVPISEATDKEITQMIIRKSLANYSGNCPCPYNTDRAGRKCGKRSAYSRPGGASPMCYASDVTKNAIERFKRQNQ